MIRIGEAARSAPVDCGGDHVLVARFRDFIEGRTFPCVGAKSALARRQMRFFVAENLTSARDDQRLYAALLDQAADYAKRPVPFQSLVALFEGPLDLGEQAFEDHLWIRLQSLSDEDVRQGHQHDPRVSGDPNDPRFSLSLGGEAVFVVGLHPRASRAARRFATPALVFNLHDQFERLRADGLYDRLRATISERDAALSGEVNPMAKPFGTGSEARQYSGRVVEHGWSCPFQRKPAHLMAAEAGTGSA